MRLILATPEQVAVQFNGPLLRFGTRLTCEERAGVFLYRKAP